MIFAPVLYPESQWAFKYSRDVGTSSKNPHSLYFQDFAGDRRARRPAPSSQHGTFSPPLAAKIGFSYARTAYPALCRI